MFRQKTIAVLVAVLGVNVFTAVLMGAGRTQAPDTVYVPDYQATLQLVSVQDRQPLDVEPSAVLPLPAAEAAEAAEADESDPDPLPADATAALEPAMPLASACWQVGPLTSADDAEALTAQIRAGGGELVRTTQSLQTIRTDRLVYLGPFDSRAQAREVRRAVQKSGLDAYVIRSGERVNAVSIGVFRKAGYAQERRERAEALGFKPQEGEVPRTEEVSHLIVKMPGERPLNIESAPVQRSDCEAQALAIASAN